MPMRFIKDTPLELGFRIGQVRPPTPSLTVVAKGTFDPLAGTPAPFAAEQLPATGPVHYEDDVQQSLRSPSDYALLKPQGECFVVGKAYTVGRRPATSLVCSFKIGPIEKKFAVFGDRFWKRGLVKMATEPEPFTEMELRMERAFGGPSQPANPLGRGILEIETERGTGVFLPNLEDVQALVNTASGRPQPVVLGPIPMTWRSRMKHAGTYDDRYLRTRWPWLPDDFDWRFFMEAPPDQRLQGAYWAGDEPISFEALHPEAMTVTSSLPAIRPRVFIELERDGQVIVEEVVLNLDTVVWDAEIGKLGCTWRGIVEVSSDTLDEVHYLYAAHDPLDGPHRSAAELKRRFDEIIAEEEAEEADAEGTPPPEFDEEPETLVDSSSPAPTPEEQEEARKLAELEATIDAAAPDPAEPPPPPDPQELIEALEAGGIEVTGELRQMASELGPPERETLVDEPPPAPARPEARELVELLLEANEPLTGLDLTGVDLRGLDLSSRDLSGSILRGAVLSQVNLARAVLVETVLIDASLQGAQLRAADLKDADLSGANLEGAILSRARLEDADLEGARLAGSQLDKVHAPRALFTGATLEGALLRKGNFAEADFDRATLSGVDASEANLTDASMEDAVADGANFDGATLLQLRAEGLVARKARFGSAVADDSFWERADLTEADFSFATLERADFSDAILVRAEMDGCKMAGATLDRADARELMARKSDLMEASFDSARLAKADFRSSNLFAAEFWRADTTDILVTMANVERTKLKA